jgi:hypothetical protein
MTNFLKSAVFLFGYIIKAILLAAMISCINKTWLSFIQTGKIKLTIGKQTDEFFFHVIQKARF